MCTPRKNSPSSSIRQPTKPTLVMTDRFEPPGKRLIHISDHSLKTSVKMVKWGLGHCRQSRTEEGKLTVNGIWGVVPAPLLQDFFVKNIGILYAYDFLTLLLKFY